MSSTPSRLKYSKRLTAIGATSAAVLSLGTASAAVTTIDANQPMSYQSGYFLFVPDGNSYTTEWSSSPVFPAVVRYCGLYLLNNSPDSFQWANALLAGGSVVDDSLTYQNTASFNFPAEGTTVHAGYRYLSSYTGEDPNYTYGYVTVTGGAVPEGGFYNIYTVNSYSYESTENTGISIAAVPEASSALLAFAGAGLLFRRRRA